ncbi:MAG: hypothetical protein WAN43_18325 [Rhodomicrobium sp.]
MRFLVVVVTIGATLAFIAASGLMNWVFMTSLGKSEFEQQIFGSVSVAVSAFIALLPTLILWAYRERRFLYVGLGVPVFCAFVAFSLSSAVGFAAKNRGGMTEDRSLATSRLASVKQEIEEAEAKRKALGAPRPSAVVQEALRGLEQDRKWQWSKECQNATNESERSFCKSYFDLKAEGARASELSLIEGKIARLKSEARGYEEKGAGRQSDSQAAVLANLLGFQAIEVERGMTLFLAVLVEIGAALGLYFATGHIRTENTAAAIASRGVGFVDAGALKDLSEIKLARAPFKQIAGPKAGPAPRRVPRAKRSVQS